jgi:hypothetical protein
MSPKGTSAMPPTTTTARRDTNDAASAKGTAASITAEDPVDPGVIALLLLLLPVLPLLLLLPVLPLLLLLLLLALVLPVLKFCVESAGTTTPKASPNARHHSVCNGCGDASGADLDMAVAGESALARAASQRRSRPRNARASAAAHQCRSEEAVGWSAPAATASAIRKARCVAPSHATAADAATSLA